VEQSLSLCLNQLTEWREDTDVAVFAEARHAVISRLAENLKQAAAGLTCVRGEPGVGKGEVIKIAADWLKTREGLNTVACPIDCENRPRLVPALSALFEDICKPVAARDVENSGETLKSFLRHLLPDKQAVISILEKFVDCWETSEGAAWRSVAIALSKLARLRKIDRMVLAVLNVSKYTRRDMEDLAYLERKLSSRDNRIRIVITSDRPAAELGLKTDDIHVERLSEKECSDLLDRVFIMPPAGEALKRALMDKSERISAYLSYLLTQLFRRKDAVLDFSYPLGVHIRDRQAFDALPTTLIETERKNAEVVDSEEIPRVFFACVGCFDIPLSVASILAVLRKLGRWETETQVREWMSKSEKREHWLMPDGKELTARSKTIREALRLVASEELCQKVHQAIYQLHEEGKLVSKSAFRHLLACPPDFVREHGERIVAGLRELIANGSFTEVNSALQKLQNPGLVLAPAQELELAVLEQELKWEESGELDEEAVEELPKRIGQYRGGEVRGTLQTRLSLVASRYYSRKGDNRKAIEVAEKAERKWGPLRSLPVSEPGLRFDFYLNLWSIYFEARDEKHFVRVDEWIWNRLRKNLLTPRAPHEIASFLISFFGFHLRFPDSEARRRYFPVKEVELEGVSRPLADNQIEVRTREERIPPSFFVKARSCNSLALARLLFQLGSRQWSTTVRAQAAPGVTNAERHATAGDKDENLIPFLLRAEEFFTLFAAPYDLAMTRRKIGETYLDRIRFVEEGTAPSSSLEPGSRRFRGKRAIRQRHLLLSRPTSCCCIPAISGRAGAEGEECPCGTNTTYHGPADAPLLQRGEVARTSCHGLRQDRCGKGGGRSMGVPCRTVAAVGWVRTREAG